jgi:glycosyltransferase involved in cell wall biosynthesis
VGKSKKRLAIFLHGLYEGGVERTILNLAQGMTSYGYAVDLVLARAAGPFLSQVPVGVRVIDLKSPRVLFSLPALTCYIRKELPDALLSAIDYTNIIALLAQRIANKPNRLVVVEHNTLSQRKNQLPYFYRLLLPKLIRLFYPWAEYIVAVSRGVADDLAITTGLRRDNIRVTYNPIITQDLRKKSQETLKHPWFEPGQPPVLISIGRLSAQKDFPNLIRAFAKVRKNRVARLMILGEGEDRPILEKMVEELGLSDEISLPGFVENPYPYMVKSSVYVLSSKWEGLPTVLVEALYCGIPIVSTDCPSGPREILQEGLFGKLVPVGNTENLALAIQDAFDGKTPVAPPISWRPYTVENILDQYNQALFGTQ